MSTFHGRLNENDNNANVNIVFCVSCETKDAIDNAKDGYKWVTVHAIEDLVDDRLDEVLTDIGFKD